MHATVLAAYALGRLLFSLRACHRSASKSMSARHQMRSHVFRGHRRGLVASTHGSCGLASHTSASLRVGFHPTHKCRRLMVRTHSKKSRVLSKKVQHDRGGGAAKNAKNLNHPINGIAFMGGKKQFGHFFPFILSNPANQTKTNARVSRHIRPPHTHTP